MGNFDHKASAPFIELERQQVDLSAHNSAKMGKRPFESFLPKHRNNPFFKGLLHLGSGGAFHFFS